MFAVHTTQWGRGHGHELSMSTSDELCYSCNTMDNNRMGWTEGMVIHP